MLRSITDRNKLVLISLGLLLIFLPITFQIDFQQNDEWVHYSILNNFLRGNFTLHPVTAPTFYSIGILALLWSKLFGIAFVPALTLLVSVGCFFVFSLMLMNRFHRSLSTSVLAGMIIFLNPIFVFTTWGFMTDNYFLLFVLISIYFLLDYSKIFNFILGNLFIIVSYLARQLGMVTSLSFGLYLLLRKDYKRGVLQLIMFVLMVFYHFVFFPKTSVMLETEFDFTHYFYIRFVFTLLFIIGMYLMFSLFPLVLNYFQNINKKLLFAVVLFSTASLLIVNLAFKPTIEWREDFPHLIYAYQQNGFFTENLHGKKVAFSYNQEIHKTIELVLKVTLIAFGLIVIFKNKKWVDYPLTYTAIYLAVMIISPKVYDRYLLPVIVVSAMFLLRDFEFSKLGKNIALVFIFIMGFYSYNFEADYFLTNKYVWNRSKQLVAQEGIKENQITSTDAWRYTYPRETEIYKFTYDDAPKGDNNEKFILIEKYDIKYPLSIWGKTTIYLYKHDN